MINTYTKTHLILPEYETRQLNTSYYYISHMRLRKALYLYSTKTRHSFLKKDMP